MSVVVLVQLDPQSREAASFREAIAAAKLDGFDRIDLRFAREEDAVRMAAEVDVVVGLHVSEAFAEAAKRLKWAASRSRTRAAFTGRTSPST